MTIESNTLAFFEFIYDRQSVWYKRSILKLPAPWSEDTILQSFRFCNVYRELDGGTREICKYLEQNLPPRQKLFNIIAYRFFNRRDTIENLFGGLLNPEDFNFKKYEQRFDNIKKNENIFSNAYLISSHPFNINYRPKDKHIQILLMLESICPKLENLINQLQSHRAQEGLKIISDFIPLAGPFLAGQILLDVTYAQNIVNYTSHDFLVVGPGAYWGLNIIFEDKLSKKQAFEKCKFLCEIQPQMFEKLKKKRGKNWFEIVWNNKEYPNYPYLSVHDIQNSLCEFRKYQRLKNGEKAKRRYYKCAESISCL